jgi:hypothetical protein
MATPCRSSVLSIMRLSSAKRPFPRESHGHQELSRVNKVITALFAPKH